MATVILRRITRKAWRCTCARCGHTWETSASKPPVACAACKSRNWNRRARWSRPDLRRPSKLPK